MFPQRLQNPARLGFRSLAGWRRSYRIDLQVRL